MASLHAAIAPSLSVALSKTPSLSGLLNVLIDYLWHMHMVSYHKEAGSTPAAHRLTTSVKGLHVGHSTMGIKDITLVLSDGILRFRINLSLGGLLCRHNHTLTDQPAPTGAPWSLRRLMPGLDRQEPQHGPSDHLPREEDA